MRPGIGLRSHLFRGWGPVPALPVTLLIVLALGLVVASPRLPALALQSAPIAPSEITHTIGGEIRFETRVLTDTPVQDIWVFIQPRGDINTIAGMATLHPSNGVSYILSLDEHPIRAFSTLDYWYQITFADGSKVTTDKETYFYEDNRFDWQQLESGNYTVFWYEGDQVFAQDVLNNAYRGQEKLQSLLPTPDPEAIKIYVYASAAEMQAALLLSGQSAGWIAGHADPSLGVALVSLPRDHTLAYEIQRQVPHEIAHIMVYQWLGEDYYKLPQWLREGLASMTELFANPDYPSLLRNAAEKETLLPIASLCTTFPLDASNFVLAYAESTDFSWYLYEKYGSPGLEELSLAYADGLNCDAGAQEALGKPLAKLDQDWRRATFGENPLSDRLQELAPWAIFLAVLLVPTVVLIVGKRKQTE